MKRLFALSIMVAVVLFVGISKSQEPNIPEPNAPIIEPNSPQRPPMPPFNPNVYRGRILVTKDANGITAVTFESKRRGMYNIVLDEKGKELGQTMENKQVVIIGKEELKDSVKWLKVESFREFQRMRRHPGDPNFEPAPREPGPRMD